MEASKTGLRACIAVALFSALTFAGGAAGAQEQVSSNGGKSLESVAHRGDKQYFPDNSLEGVESAIEKGADWIEIDLHYNPDGDTFFLSHDNVCKGEGGSASIDSASYQTVVARCGLPELHDVFEIVKNTGYSSFVYEFKSTMHTAEDGGARLAEELTEQGLHNESFVSAFSESALDAIKSEQPAIKLMRVRAWTGEIPVTKLWIDATAKRGYDAININLDALRPELVEYAKSMGLIVSAWGWPDALESDNKLAIEMGVDMFMTDRLEDLEQLTA